MSSGIGLPADESSSYAEIERAAARLRKILDFAPMDLLPGRALFESLDRYTVRPSHDEKYPLNYAVGEIEVEAQAEFDPENREFVVKLREGTYDLLEGEEDRARFSLTHEIGHVVLHARQLMRLSRIPHEMTAALYRGKPEHPVHRDTEWQAFAFGAALLMPAAGIREIEVTKGHVSNRLLRNAYKVSYAAAEKRLDVYGRKKHELI